ncbi:three-helix bundle dimerization domain-containing protein [Nocardia sp. IFM 10818]
MAAPEEDQQIDELITRLAIRFPHLTSRVVAEVVRGIHREFDGHRVREFIPLLVERIAERHLSRRVSYCSSLVHYDAPSLGELSVRPVALSPSPYAPRW